ncbi:unnamed protein product [Peronospora farinosa]|uniref:LAGLIDADG endonuclease n=1 Tax=Peronospora farinosa TaxID=134698 RepID=A0ABN8C2Z7_9STRA|nr:unnamed protein product [Peronospora farinosa]
MKQTALANQAAKEVANVSKLAGMMKPRLPCLSACNVPPALDHRQRFEARLGQRDLFILNVTSVPFFGSHTSLRRQYVYLGSSGLLVSRLSFGSRVTFKTQLDFEKAFSILKHVYKQGPIPFRQRQDTLVEIFRRRGHLLWTLAGIS